MDKNFKLTIAYEGTRYLGWQRQSKENDRTIQGKLENILFKMSGKKVEVIGSGRTDSGVHAKNQIANFHMDTEKTAKDIKEYINRYLPEDIVIKAVTEESSRFHSRYHVIHKTYLYRIYTKKEHPVFERKYVYHLPDLFDIKGMKAAAQELVGKHDFKGFSSKNTKKSTVREIYEVHIEEKTDEILIYIKANGFLYNMVRIIVGTLIEIGQGTREVSDIQKILLQKDRQAAGMTAPPQGLILYEVVYE